MKAQAATLVPAQYGLEPGKSAARVAALLEDYKFIFPGDVLVRHHGITDEKLVAQGFVLDQARVQQAIPSGYFCRAHCRTFLQR